MKLSAWPMSVNKNSSLFFCVTKTSVILNMFACEVACLAHGSEQDFVVSLLRYYGACYFNDVGG